MEDKIKSIVILGGSGGMGKSVIDTLKNSEVSIIATGSTADSSNRINKNLNNPRIISCVLDLEKPETFKDFIHFIENKMDEIDWLINCAGFIDPSEKKSSYGSELISKTFKINAESVINLEDQIIPMIKKGGGVINVSSTAGIWGNPDYPIYSASKSALINFGISVSKKYSSSISSFVVCPGPTNTNMRRLISNDSNEQQDPSVVAELINKIILGSKKYQNGDVIIVRNNQEEIFSRLNN